MKHIKLFEDFASVEPTMLNVLAGNQIGTEPAKDFLSKHDLDLEALKKAKMQGEIDQYEIRDVVRGVAPSFKVKQFLKKFTK